MTKHCPYCDKPIANRRRTCGARDCVGADGIAWLEARRAARKQRPRPTPRPGFTRAFRLAVHERCGWTCHICELPIDPTEVYPSIASAVVDHIKPLALGGTNDDDNLASAHSYCNLVKGNREAVA